MKENLGTLTCPKCGNKQQMKIPTGICMPFYICNKCKKEIKSKNGCCVFCDYGDKKCPVGH